MTTYDDIYDRALSKFKSYDIPDMSEQELRTILLDYLKSAITKFYICSIDLTDRDDDLQTFNADIPEVEQEILASYLVYDYIDANYIRVPNLLKAQLSSKDFQSFSPANLLEKLNQTQKILLENIEVQLQRYSWLQDHSNLMKLVKPKNRK